LKKFFSRLPICLLVDGLYTNVALMDVCKQNQWKFITVLKDGNLPSVREEVESLLPLAKNTQEQIVCDPNYWYTYTYNWIKDLDYKKHDINWMECIVEKQHRESKETEIKRFVYLTNLDVNKDSVAGLIKAGRARWCIEDHFNTQKNRGHVLHHKFSRINFNAIKCWHHARQLACLIGELVEYSQEIRQIFKEISIMTFEELWKNLASILTYNQVDEVVAEFEHWSKSRRQVRLE